MKKSEERTTAGVRELKAHLSRYVGLVKEGRAVYVTEHGKPVARIVPAGDPGADRLWELVREGIVRWNGGRPKGSRRRIRARGKPTSRVVLEMRHESLF